MCSNSSERVQVLNWPGCSPDFLIIKRCVSWSKTTNARRLHSRITMCPAQFFWKKKSVFWHCWFKMSVYLVTNPAFSMLLLDYFESDMQFKGFAYIIFRFYSKSESHRPFACIKCSYFILVTFCLTSFMSVNFIWFDHLCWNPVFQAQRLGEETEFKVFGLD